MTRHLSRLSLPQVGDPQVLAILQKEAQLRPHWADVQNRWGLHQFSRGQWKEARAAFERALEQNPYYAWASLNLAATLWMMGDRQAAWKRHAKTQDMQPGKALTAAWMYLLEGELDEAEAQIERVTEGNQERPDVLWFKTALAEARGEDASRSWHLLLSDPLIIDDPDCITGLKEEDDPGCGLFPGFHDYWTGVSTIQARLGRFGEAGVAARRAYIFLSQPAGFLNQMAYLHSMQGNDERAVEVYRQCVEVCPTDVKAPQELARYYFSQDDLDQAQYYMRIALDRGPNYADLQREMAQLEAASGRDEEALEWVRKALSINPNFRTAQLEEAYYLFCLSRWEEAAQAYRRAVEFQLHSSDVYLHLGRCYEHLGEAGKAEQAYKNSIKLNEQEAVAYYRLSILYRDEDKPEMAEDTWRAYEKLASSPSLKLPPDAGYFQDDEQPLADAAA